MNKITSILFTLVLVAALSACSLSQVTAFPQAEQNTDTTSEAGTSIVSNATGSTTLTNTFASSASAADTLADNQEMHADTEDYAWDDSAVISITLGGDAITTSGEGVVIEGSTATITTAGTYSLSGSLADGQIIVDTQSEDVVRLILIGADLHNSTTAPLFVRSAEKVMIVLAESTTNAISDGASYVYADPVEEEPNAAIFSVSDLTIYGSGSLTVNGNFNDGISSKDGLVIASGTLTVNAIDDGIRGKDYVVVQDGNMTINAQGDGLNADNELEAERGYISVEAGVLNITAGGDALDAASDVIVTGGELVLSSGGGSRTHIAETQSAKGIKAAASIVIEAGILAIDSADDAINTNGSLVVNGGTFTLSSGGDGMHADSTLKINGGDIQIMKSYEGIESAIITINAGTVSILASDDGINVAGGVDSSGMNAGFGPGARPGQGPGQDAFTYSGDFYLYINGGSIIVDASGDGLDVNGAVEMIGGAVIVNGPTENNNGALDYDGGFMLTGGFIVAAGSAGMAQVPDQSSSQNFLLVNFTSTQRAGTLVSILNSSGEAILTFSPARQYQSIAFSSSELVTGETYRVYLGGSSTGTASSGLYQGGAYTSGDEYESFTVSSVVTMLGSAGMRPGRP